MSISKKQTRAAFRKSVFDRDNHCCAVCGAVGELDAHHIIDRNEMPNGGYVQENGISLCPDCHWKAEQLHCTGTAVEGFAPDDLYKIIGSHKALAVRKSEKLNKKH